VFLSGYDVIGDVHGCADQLEGLLGLLGYVEFGGSYAYSGPHATRQAIFVGDLIDRGAQQVRTLEIVRAMIDSGSAQMVMGNHEFNAIAYATPDPGRAGEYVRPHTERNWNQHQSFIEQVGDNPGLYEDSIAWFATLPLWLDLGDIRVVHACWSEAAIVDVARWLPPGSAMEPDFVVRANRKGTPEHRAIEVILKGPELSLSRYGQPAFVDKDGHARGEARIRWWDREGTTLRELAEIPGSATTPKGVVHPKLPLTQCPEEATFRYEGTQPVFYGHYWRHWKPTAGMDWTDNTVCVDFSAVKGGPLVAYRWDAESGVSPERYVGFPLSDP
jgi:hypothetical protein